MAGLIKAIVEILDSAAVSPRLPAIFPVQFNPTNVLVTKAVNYAEANIPGLNGPLLQFLSGGAETMDLELFFDTTDSQEDVRLHTQPLHELVTVQPHIHAPPRFRFVWGTGLSFQAVATGITEHFTLFNSHGVPLRAVVQLSMKEYHTLEGLLNQQNLKSSRVGSKRRGTGTGEHSVYPSAEIRLDGEDEPLAGFLAAKFRDRTGMAGRFELEIDNWDDNRRTLRTSNGGAFEVGRGIEIQLGYSECSLVRGQVDTVRQVFAREGRPRMLLEGTGSLEPAEREGKSNLPVLHLAYGETLLELELVQDGPGASARGFGLGNSSLHAGTHVSFEGFGARFGGTYRVTSSIHSFDTNGYTTGFECTP